MGKYTEVNLAGGKLYSNDLELYRNKILKLYTFHKIKMYSFPKNVHLLGKNHEKMYIFSENVQ